MIIVMDIGSMWIRRSTTGELSNSEIKSNVTGIEFSSSKKQYLLQNELSGISFNKELIKSPYHPIAEQSKLIVACTVIHQPHCVLLVVRRGQFLKEGIQNVLIALKWAEQQRTMTSN